MKPARIFLFTILYVSLTFLYTSCVREDTGDCIQYVLDMQAVDSEGNDLTATDALQKVEVYLFRSEEHTSELQSHHDLVCRLLLEKKK